MKLITVNGITPRVHPSVYCAEGVCLIGDVEIASDASIWFNSTLRGDINKIRIGERTNIQDGSVIHVTHECPVEIGADVTVGHRAIIHGATIGYCSLIGMGSVVLDRANVGPNCVVAAGAVVLENAIIPEGKLVAGVPARILRDLTTDEKSRLRESAASYVTYARAFRT